ncbi:hypothetical protein [Verminephrobacter aporrectodeae]|nr:hypothetical protein [Verminephrobacter aporrectodeae]
MEKGIWHFLSKTKCSQKTAASTPKILASRVSFLGVESQPCGVR